MGSCANIWGSFVKFVFPAHFTVVQKKYEMCPSSENGEEINFVPKFGEKFPFQQWVGIILDSLNYEREKLALFVCKILYIL